MKELTMSEVEQVSGGRGRRRSGNRPSAGFQNSTISRFTMRVVGTAINAAGPIGVGVGAVLNGIFSIVIPV